LRIFELTQQKILDEIVAVVAHTPKPTSNYSSPSMTKLRQTVLWIFSILLGLIFVAVGLSKLEGSSATRWAERFLHWGYPAGSQYVVGTIEVIAGIAMVIPRWRKTAAWIAIIIMAGALYTHAHNGEFPRIISPLVLGSLAFLVLSLHSRASVSGK